MTTKASMTFTAAQKAEFIADIQAQKADGRSAAGRTICPLPEGEHKVNINGTVKRINYEKGGEKFFLVLAECETGGKKFDAICSAKFASTCVASETTVKVDKERRAAIMEAILVVAPLAVVNQEL